MVAVVAYSGRDPHDARRTKIFYKQLTGPGPREWVWWVPRDSRADSFHGKLQPIDGQKDERRRVVSVRAG